MVLGIILPKPATKKGTLESPFLCPYISSMIKIPSHDEVFWPEADHFIATDVYTWIFYGRWKYGRTYAGDFFSMSKLAAKGKWKIK